jgi:hypothetical protein
VYAPPQCVLWECPCCAKRVQESLPLSKSFVAALISANEKLRHNSDGRDEPCVFVELVFVKANRPHPEATPVESKSLVLLLSRKVTKPRIESRVTPEIAPPMIMAINGNDLFALSVCFVLGVGGVETRTGSEFRPARQTV